MKRWIFFKTLPVMAMLLTVIACEDKEPQEIGIVSPGVRIDCRVVSDTGIEATFTPEKAAGKFIYAIGTDDDRDAFINNTLAGIKEGRETVTALFTDLEPDKLYTLYARAYDNEGNSGSVTTKRQRTFVARDISLVNTYLSDKSAGFVMRTTNNFYRFEYAITTEENIEAFENGTLGDIRTKDETDEWGVNYFDLQPGTRYYFYVRAIDRSGNPTPVLTEVIDTYPSADDIPSLEVVMEYNEIFQSVLTFKPNTKAGKYGFRFSVAGDLNDDLLHDSWANFRGDYYRMYGTLVELFNPWDAQVWVVEDGQYTDAFWGNYFTPGVDMRCRYAVYDTSGNLFAIHQYDFSSPQFDNSLPIPSVVGVSIDNVTSVGADFVINVSEDCDYVLFDSYDKARYDLDNPDKDPQWIINLLANNFDAGAGIFRDTRENKTINYTETTAWASAEYYLIVIPMNANGRAGAGEIYYGTYTTDEDDNDWNWGGF